MLTKYNRGTSLPTLSNVLENFFDTDVVNFLGTDVTSTIPAVNVKETNDAYKVDVAAPGLKKEDFKINLENNILTIKAEKETKQEEKDENNKFRRKEFSYTSFQRSFSLPDIIEEEKIQAKYENGILCITVPKKEIAIKKQAKNIKIE